MPYQEKTPDPGGIPGPQLPATAINNNNQSSQISTAINSSTLKTQTLDNCNALIIKNWNDIRFEEDSTSPFIVTISKPGIGNEHQTHIGEFLYKAKISGLKTITAFHTKTLHASFS